MSNDIQLLTNRLLAALNSSYEVIDMSSVLSVITQLEQTKITKEQLEATRLAKFINLFRKKTWSEPLARRAKNLLKKWREMHISPTSTIQQIQHRQQQQQPQQQNQQHQSPSLSINSETQSLSRTSHPILVSLSQPTSPVAQTTESLRSARHSSNQPRSIENSSLPEYPCCSSSITKKNVPTTSRKQQQMHSSLSNGGQHRTELASGIHRTPSNKSAISKPTKGPQLQQPQSSIKQPISFANLIESQIHSPAPSRSGAGSSFLMEDNRSQSPLPLPRIPRIPRDHQSSMIIEHSVSPMDLDQNSNPSREGSLAPPSIVSGPATLAVMNNNNTISSCSRLLNGDYAAMPIDLHDSNSNSNMPGNLNNMMEAQQLLLGSRSSEHRKSKKHKKEKKRHKQERFQDGGPSGLSQLGGKPPGGDRVPVLSDETQIYGGNIFPMQENLSLSNSSLSIFPSASTNVTVTNSNRGAGSSTQKLESDLTFAGKFKKSSSSVSGTTGGPHGASDIAVGGDAGSAPLEVPLVNNGQETAYATVITPVKKAKHKDDRNSVVVIESRSCSPFTPIDGNSNDSSASSSPNSNRDLIEVVNQESQGAEDVRMRSSLPQQNFEPLKPIEIDTSVPEETKVPKRRGRKKGSKGADAMLAQFNTQLFEGSRLLSLASLSGNKKVKTTKELLADIQSRKLESTTSSPTLPSQSRPPSTSSEPSLHSLSTSDACSTNATMSTVTRSTPDQIIVSASNFRAGVDDDSDSNSSGTAVDKKEPLGFDDETKSVVKVEEMHSYEDDIQKLISSLPTVNRDEIKWEMDDEVLCTCSVREVQQQQVDVVLPNEENGEEEMQNGVNAFGETLKPIQKHEPMSAASRAPSPIKLKLPQKPVKSIFDLDYDEENDPLRSFVEAAKSCKTEGDSDSNQMDTKPPSPEVKKQQETKMPTVSLTLQEQRSSPASSIASDPVQPAVAPVFFPQFEVVEDPNCVAKQRYEVQTNRICKFHVDAVHNRYIPNVNGNWDESEPKNIDDDGQRITAYDEITPDGLYVRVVPQYNFPIMDRIPKDLSHVQFIKNYNKIKKLKLEKMKMKRKRSGSSSTVAEDEENKHQRKRECTALTMSSPHDNCENGNGIMTGVTVKSELNDGFDNNMNLNNCTDSLSGSGKVIDTEKPNDDRMDCSSVEMGVEVTLIMQANTTAESDSMAVSGRVDSLPPPEIVTSNNSNHTSNGSRRSSSCSNSSVNLRLSCSNNSSKPNNDISNNIDDAGDNSVDPEELSYGHSNGSEDREDEDDAYEDDEYDDDDEEEEDDDEHGDFHEVVTHDMTSSTSTIGNKLVLTIKKTPNKNTPQSSPSLSLSSQAEAGTSRKRKIITNDGNSNGGEHEIIDNNEKDMAVAPANVDSISDNENLNSFKAVLESHDLLDPVPESNTTGIFPSSDDCDIKVEPIDIGPDYCVIEDFITTLKDGFFNEVKPCSSPGDPDQSDLKTVIKSSPQSMSRSSSPSDISPDANEIDVFLPDENNQLLPSFNHLGEENRTGVRIDTRTGKPQQFKEWHEVLQVRSYNDELLTVLPYVVID